MLFTAHQESELTDFSDVIPAAQSIVEASSQIGVPVSEESYRIVIVFRETLHIDLSGNSLVQIIQIKTTHGKELSFFVPSGGESWIHQ